MAIEMNLNRDTIIQKKLSPLTSEAYIFEEIPNFIKISKTINDALQSPDLRRFLRKATFLKSLYISEESGENENTVKTIEEREWKITVNGNALTGRFLEMDDEKLHGYGKKVDIQGNLLIGNFAFGNFRNGIVYTSKSFVYSIPECRNNRYLDCSVQIYTNFKMDFIFSGKIKNGFLNGKGKISFLKKPNWFLDNPENMIMFNNVECKTFKDGHLNGKAWIVDARFPNQSDMNSAFEIKVEYNLGKISYIYFSVSKSLKLIHDAKPIEFNDHNCLILQKYDRSISYYGKLDGFFENKRSIKITDDFVSYENKNYQRAMGLCHYNYPSHDAFMEIDWRFDEEFDDQNVQVQVGDGIQYMEKAGVMIYGRWVRNYQLEKPSVWRFDRILTSSGGDYKGEPPRNSQGLYFEFSNRIEEKPKYGKMYKVPQYVIDKNLDDNNKHRNFITVMVDNTDTIYSDIHITSGESLENVKKAYVFNNGIYAEGEVSLDIEYNTCSLTGKGVYVENDLNFIFQGELSKDDFTRGKLSSGYAILEGIFDDFVFREGKATLRFYGGIVFQGNFKNQSVNGPGKLLDSKGKVLEEGEWVNGVLEPKRVWMITHGDKNQRYHRLCLYKLKESLDDQGIPKFEHLRNNENEEDKVEENNNDQQEVNPNENVIIKLDNLDMRTLTIYNKIFYFKFAKLQMTQKGNLKLIKSYGEMACRAKSNSLRRYEAIKNPDTYGCKTLTMVLYNFPKSNTIWKKCGIFSKEVHKVCTIQIDFLGYFKGLFDISQKDFHSVDLVKYVTYDFQKDPLNLKILLKDDTINDFDDLKFSYYIYRDLDERFVIRLKKDDEFLNENRVKGRDKFNGVVLHSDGAISYGEIERCFLNGKGVKVYYPKDFYLTNDFKRRLLIEESEQNSEEIKRYYGGGETVYFLLRQEGEFFCDKLIGTSILEYSNGAVYKGGTKLGKRHGEGEMRYRNGEVYKGEWFCGIKHGKGEYFYKKSGEKYEGEFKLNMFWGNGSYSFSNGFYMIGNFAKNEAVEGEYEVFDNEGNKIF